MSQIISAIPANALLPVAGALVGWVGHMAWHHAERAHVAAGKLAIRRFQAENDAWLDGHKARFAPAAAIEAAIEAAPEEKPHEAEVLHVEYPTGELRALNAADPAVAAGLADLAEEVGLAQALDDESGHKPTCPDLYYCPTVDEVESGCHGGFDVCCTAPELHMPIPDEHDDEDAPADDTDRPGLHLVLLALVWDLTDRAHNWLSVLIDDVLNRFKSDERRDAEFRQALDAEIDAAPWVLYDEDELRAQGASEDELRMLREGYASTPYDEATDAEARQLELEAWRAAHTRPPRHASDELAQDTGYRGSRWAQDVQHTGTFPIVPAQRSGDADA